MDAPTSGTRLVRLTAPGRTRWHDVFAAHADCFGYNQRRVRQPALAVCDAPDLIDADTGEWSATSRQMSTLVGVPVRTVNMMRQTLLADGWWWTLSRGTRHAETRLLLTVPPCLRHGALRTGGLIVEHRLPDPRPPLQHGATTLRRPPSEPDEPLMVLDPVAVEALRSVGYAVSATGEVLDPQDAP